MNAFAVCSPRALRLVATGLLCATSMAWAQVPLVLAPAAYTDHAMRIVTDRQRLLSQQGGVESASLRTATPHATTLRFQRNPAVAHWAESVQLQAFRHSDPLLAQVLEGFASRHDAVATFREMVGQYGYSPDDLSATAATELIVAWMIVHDAPEPSPAQFEAVRRQLHASLLQNPTVLELNSDALQATSDPLLLRSVTFAIARGAPELRTREQREQLRQRVAALVRESSGLDIQRLTLAEEGFR
ncbi:hypothetical protein DN824_12830 [Stutzerimonas nosocomialis]|uniref:Uncharacterized protein n=1 Tax=Stutzerimonas nosocomialis TaxID=1056496 RepID=A0A5R9QGN3_9GAMM|nr:DUF6683 family protein [Stutzerimonas nosocomialis]TLX57103.1 hypothetical protein DN824_12830 [Stutzerimonas nosocomialis]TLX64002.1 hypothetical protein DN820_08300 [Stutzerimonas nosocomialis]